MKCGLICARRARTSASINRVREASSSASSRFPDTQRATSATARTSPAEADEVKACRVPTTLSSTTSGLTTTCRSPQATSEQAKSLRSRTTVLPDSRTTAASAAASRSW
jgi:hypothetical protein